MSVDGIIAHFGRRAFGAVLFVFAVPNLLPLERAERLTTQRLGFMFGRVGDLAVGMVCTLMAAVLVLPIPLGNMLPAAAIALLALSLTQRDGLLSIGGYLTALTSIGVLALSGRVVMAAVARLGSLTDLW